MAQKVTHWQAVDGTYHQTQAEAEHHEMMLKVAEILKRHMGPEYVYDAASDICVCFTVTDNQPEATPNAL